MTKPKKKIKPVKAWAVIVQELLANRFYTIWREVFGEDAFRKLVTGGISGMERQLFKEYLQGSLTEQEVRENLKKIKLFNS